MVSSSKKLLQQPAPALPEPQPKTPRSSSKSASMSTAYAAAVEPYTAGTELAERLWSWAVPGEQPTGADHEWVLKLDGRPGVVTKRTDAHGRLVAAWQAREKPTRRKSRYRARQHPEGPQPVEWVTVPELYAIAHGGVKHRLTHSEIGEWSKKLLAKASPPEPSERGFDWQWHPFPLPDPDPDPEAKANDDDGGGVWLSDFGVLRGSRTTRRTHREERLIHAIYVRFFAARWECKTARVVWASDAYIAGELVRLGVAHSDTATDLQQRVRRAIAVLEAAGYIEAVAVRGAEYFSTADGRSLRKRAGFYAYFPGTGERRLEGAGRHQQLSVHAPINALRRLTGGYGLDLPRWARWLKEAHTAEERAEVQADFRAHLQRRRRP